jgi:general secretion pathway protein N
MAQMARLLTFWWIPVAAAFVLVIAAETNWGEALHSPLVIAPAPDAKPIAPALLPEYKPAAGPEAYAEVIDRPLFSPTRRQAPPPPPPDPPKPPKPVMQAGQYQLTGTIQVGDKLYAFLKETKGGKGIRVAQGDVLSSGIMLAKVEPDRVLLTQYDSEEEVKLQVSKSTRTTPAPPPSPGAPGIPGIPGAPGPQPQPASVRQNVDPEAPPNPATAQPAGAPFVPGTSTLAPFVPGITGTANPRSGGGNEVPPRRRGAMQ